MKEKLVTYYLIWIEAQKEYQEIYQWYISTFRDLMTPESIQRFYDFTEINKEYQVLTPEQSGLIYIINAYILLEPYEQN